ncbi:MAG: SagB/ThcOx family dehydrogenase [Desulfobulbales bacterium]|nr:SagB/ThcOx family dehydrogenase [Desulfobulbales bacterium]
MIKLPSPRLDGAVAVESAITRRRSIRTYAEDSLVLPALAQLLWAGQGITGPGGRRAAPSAGALYPLELYLVAGSILDLEAGVYRYLVQQHGLVQVRSTDRRAGLAAAASGQKSVAAAPLCLIIGAVYQRTAGKYRTRARRYVQMEAGHAAQNILLQAAALQLGGVIIGAFDDRAVQLAARMAADHEPLVLIPIGRPRE